MYVFINLSRFPYCTLSSSNEQNDDSFFLHASFMYCQHCVFISKPFSHNRSKGIVWAPIQSNEEQILRDPSNAVRCCDLDIKYVKTLDLELEQGDKEFLYEMGRVETLKWMKTRAAEVK